MGTIGILMAAYEEHEQSLNNLLIFYHSSLALFDNLLCKNQKIRAIRSTRKNIKKRHKKHREKIRNLASETILTQGFFSSERKGQKEKSKNSAVSRKSRKGKFLQVSLLKNAKWVCEGTGHISSLFYLVN